MLFILGHSHFPTHVVVLFETCVVVLLSWYINLLVKEKLRNLWLKLFDIFFRLCFFLFLEKRRHFSIILLNCNCLNFFLELIYKSTMIFTNYTWPINLTSTWIWIGFSLFDSLVFRHSKGSWVYFYFYRQTNCTRKRINHTNNNNELVKYYLKVS